MCLAMTVCHVEYCPLRQANTVCLGGARNRLRFVSIEQIYMRRASQERRARTRRERDAEFVKRSLSAESDRD